MTGAGSYQNQSDRVLPGSRPMFVQQYALRPFWPSG